MQLSIDQMCKAFDDLRAERDQLRHALQTLYDASPTSCDDKALNEAQILAEKLLFDLPEGVQP